MEPHSTQNILFENWVRFHSNENQESNEDDHGTLSLCDFAINKNDHHPEVRFSEEHNEDFDFGGRNLPKNKMCSAGELFYQGQIVPVNLPSGFMTRSKSYSRSETVSVASSRSSSTRSSGTSDSSLSRSEFTIRNRNQFHSHPSPKPQIWTRSFRQSNPKSSSKWSLLQLGPVKQQEIVLADLRNRRQRSHASSSNMKGQHQKKSQNQILLFGGCNCKYSANVVESTVSLMVKPTTNLKEEDTRLLWISKQNNDSVRRSSHSTSERLNQLHFHATK